MPLLSFIMNSDPVKIIFVRIVQCTFHNIPSHIAAPHNLNSFVTPYGHMCMNAYENVRTTGDGM